MKRITDTISPKQWDHLITKYPPNSKMVTEANFTRGTANIDTDIKGNITKRRGSITYCSGVTKQDQYEMIFEDGTRHLLTVGGGILRYTIGDGIEHIVTSGYASGTNFEFTQTQDRAYFGNGVDEPQVYDKVSSYGGVTYSVPKTKEMGCQVPTSAPTVMVVAGGNVPIGSHTYKITFLYYDFEESNGGPASAVATITSGFQTVDLSNIPIGGYGVTARKIYRDNNDGNWVFLDVIDNNTSTTYVDTINSPSTPTPIPFDNGLPPSFGLIASWLDALWLAKIEGEPYMLFYSGAGTPDIYPSDFTLICNEQDPITAIYVYLGRLIVFNRKSFGQILGTTPDQFRYDPIESSIGCVDNRSIQVRVVRGIPILIWLSDRGFYSYNGNSIEYISDPIEDQVNASIQQTISQRGSNTQNTQAQFESDTYSEGIDLTSNPGIITTENPQRLWQDEEDWTGGSSLSDIATEDGTNTLKTIPASTILLSTGTTDGGAMYELIENDSANVFIHDVTLASGTTEGTWTSALIDTFSLNPSVINLHLLGSTDINAPTITEIQSSDDEILWTTQATYTNLNGNQSLSLSGHRFWRLFVTLTTPDNTHLPYIGVRSFTPPTPPVDKGDPILSYGTPGIWISEAIDCTSDVTAYDTFTPSYTTPSNSSITVLVASSADNITYTSFVPFGSITVQRYFKVKVILNLSTDNISPYVTSILFQWTIVANIVSTVIDTITTPSGWDIFTAGYMTNGGMLQWYMRSGATVFACTSASFILVNIGTFPTAVTPNRYIQWKIIFTSTANKVPTVSSITVNWFITLSSAIRVASIFYNGSYYMSAAQFGRTFNNIIFVLDLDGKWRVYQNLFLATLSFFFDFPYASDAFTGNMIKFLDPTSLQDQGGNILSQVRFKAADFSTGSIDASEYLKIIDYVVFQGIGTGATYQMYYSIDEGNTFIQMFYEDGTFNFTSNADEKAFFVRFKASKNDTDLISGRSIMILITNDDQFDINIQSIKIFGWMWEFEPFLLGS